MVRWRPAGKAGLFNKTLAKLNIRPDEIKLIVLTHSHFDHSGSAAEIRDLTGARIAVHESERTFLEEGGMIIPKGVNLWGKLTRPVFFPIFKRIKFPRLKPDLFITDKPHSLAEFGIEGSIIHTPGHTFGSLSVVLDTGDAFVGCMAHNGWPFRLRPGLPIYALDIGVLLDSWRTLLARGVKMIYPGHGKPFPAEIMGRCLRKIDYQKNGAASS